MLVLLVLALAPFANCHSNVSLTFAIDYFKLRNVPFICLISCDEQNSWNTKCAAEANKLSIRVSSFRTDVPWLDSYEHCMQQRLTFIGVLMMADCGKSEELFYVASQNLWLDSKHVWLILDNRVENSTIEVENTTAEIYVNYHKIIRELDLMNISVDADIVMAVNKGSYYKLYDIFNFGKIQGGSLNVIDAGTWDMKSGLNANLTGYKYYRRWNFGQNEMRLVSVSRAKSSNDTRLLTSLLPVPGVSVVTRTGTIIMLVVGEVHNITFVHKLTDRWYNGYDINSSRSVSSSLYFREQDVTTVLRVLKVFIDNVGLIPPALTIFETKYYYRIPSSGPGKYENQFLIPLSEGSWWSMIAVCVICVIILIMAAIYERRPSAFQYAFFSVFAGVCQQFFEDEDTTSLSRKSEARRLTLLVTGTFCVLIYNYYTSSVVSWLLNGPPPTLNSLQELYESSLDIVMEDIGYTRSWLYNPDYYFNKRYSKEEDKLKNKVLGKKSALPITTTAEEGIAMVKAGGFAFHTESENANRRISETFTESELCEVGSLPSTPKTQLYPAVQRNSPYKEFFTWSLTRLLERGIVSCVQRRTLAPPVTCEAVIPRPLALGGAAPAFILLVMGYIMATGIMVVERLLYMKTRRNLGFSS